MLNSIGGQSFGSRGSKKFTIDQVIDRVLSEGVDFGDLAYDKDREERDEEEYDMEVEQDKMQKMPVKKRKEYLEKLASVGMEESGCGMEESGCGMEESDMEESSDMMEDGTVTSDMLTGLVTEMLGQLEDFQAEIDVEGMTHNVTVNCEDDTVCLTGPDGEKHTYKIELVEV